MTEPTSSSEDSETFTKFPELPKELRLLIWQAAIPGRLVKLFSSSNSLNSRNIPQIPFSKVCKEAQDETKKKYCPVFDPHLTVDYPEFSKVLFNPGVDILMIDINIAEFLAKMEGDELLKYQYIAIYDPNCLQLKNEERHHSDRRSYGVNAIIRLFERLVSEPLKEGKLPRLEWMRIVFDDPAPSPFNEVNNFKSDFDERYSEVIQDRLGEFYEDETGKLYQDPTEDDDISDEERQKWLNELGNKTLVDIRPAAVYHNEFLDLLRGMGLS